MSQPRHDTPASASTASGNGSAAAHNPPPNGHHPPPIDPKAPAIALETPPNGLETPPFPVATPESPPLRSGGAGSPPDTRVTVRGKFLFLGDEKFFVKGVTYGPFRPEPDGCEYHTPELVERDFALMAANGINAVRVYTVPPRWLLDIALRHGLRVMIGLSWYQDVTFLDNPRLVRDAIERVRTGVRACAGHPAVLAFAVGNEVPASIVRWHGRRPIERFLARLCATVRAEDPHALVTYVNFPTTEYLQLPFVDFICFNVYLEQREKLEGYLARLQNLAGDKPLVMGEIGLDSMRNGQDVQAHKLDWQIRTAFACGCAGAFVFAWTDEWFRGGNDILDWAFGLVDRDRQAKPALDAIRDAYAQAPFPLDDKWPRISIVICSYNGARTLEETLHHVTRLDYPDYEVIVVNDGSKDHTSDIAQRYAGQARRGEGAARGHEEEPASHPDPSSFTVRVINLPNGGLSNARNVGARAATGQIVAYLDDDAYPDPHWLQYLAYSFRTTRHMGVGGPNIPPPGDGIAAACVAHSPGGPNHVLLSDTFAEHIPGCNMAFRRSALLALGGFDTRFRIAGDDVDLCWRLLDRGWTIGYHPAAMVWHHRRGSVRTYLRQQTNYGRAEAMLEQKWPQKFNGFGHVTWGGRLYGYGMTLPAMLRRQRVFHGVWGSSLFQSIYTRPTSTMQHLPMMPEWWLVVAVLVILSASAIVWNALWVAVPLLALALGVPMIQAMLSARHAPPCPEAKGFFPRLRYRATIAALHLLQPIVRLKGRLTGGLSLLRRHRVTHTALPGPRTTWRRCPQGGTSEGHLASLERALASLGVRCARGGDFDRWDLELRGCGLGNVRVILALEQHGPVQFIRLRSWPVFSHFSLFVGGLLTAATVAAAIATMPVATLLLAAGAFALILRAAFDCANVTGVYLEAIRPLTDEDIPEGEKLPA